MAPEQKVVDRLLSAWRGEIQARFVYEILAEREQDPRRADILRRIAEAEAGHRRRLAERLTQLGVPVPDETSVRISLWLRLQARGRVASTRHHGDGVDCLSFRPLARIELSCRLPAQFL